ncbi:MAG: ATP-binding cassette domain-containing protein [Candidatus Paceibacteria bacterium]
MMDIAVEIKNLDKSFGEVEVFRNFDLEIEQGKITTIFGPNGAGKTTLLSLISNLKQPDQGKVKVDKTIKSNMSYLTQDYQDSLMPWETNFENAAFPMRMKGIKTEKIKDRLKTLEESLEFSFDWEGYPYNLSGGQQQILAFIRTIITNPDLLLIDEPFSALDYENNLKFRDFLQKYYLKYESTVILVTHNIDEAVYLSDSIILLSGKESISADENWNITTEGEQSEDIDEITFADLPVQQSLPLYVAMERGYFQEKNLNVNREIYKNPTRIIESLLEGKADITTSGALGIMKTYETEKSKQLRAFSVAGGKHDNPHDSLLIRKDMDISPIEGLKNKTVGILPGVQWKTIAKKFFDDCNLQTSKDLKLKPTPLDKQVKALKSGDIDALMTIEPIPTIALSQNIAEELVSGPVSKNMKGPFYGGAGIISQNFINSYPKTSEKILDIFRKSITYISEHSRDSLQYLTKYTDIKEGVISELPKIEFKMYEDLTKDETRKLQEFFNVFALEGIITGETVSERIENPLDYPRSIDTIKTKQFQDVKNEALISFQHFANL